MGDCHEDSVAHTGNSHKPEGMRGDKAHRVLEESFHAILEAAKRTMVIAAIEPHGTFSLTGEGLTEWKYIIPLFIQEKKQFLLSSAITIGVSFTPDIVPMFFVLSVQFEAVQTHICTFRLLIGKCQPLP